ncbi:MAG: histidine phosphatase family protein [Sphingomicrobium sp.]
MRRLACILLALAPVVACTAPDRAASPAASAEPMTQVPTFYVSRHMRKGAGDDPPLSAQGAVEAARLADLLKGKGISAIFVTDTVRSRQTAAPLAAATGAPVETYDPRDNAALARRAAAIPGSILIVGHSNTVPAIVAALGGTPPGPMSEEDFGRLFAVERANGKTVETRL